MSLPPVHADKNFGDSHPIWSPDGTQVAVVVTQYGGSFEENVNTLLFFNSLNGSYLTEETLPTPIFRDSSISWSPELPVNLTSVPPFGQFLIVFMLGAVSALWMTRRNAMVVRD